MTAPLPDPVVHDFPGLQRNFEWLAQILPALTAGQTLDQRYLQLAGPDTVYLFGVHVNADASINKALGAPPGLACVGGQNGPGGYKLSWTAGAHPNGNVAGIAIGTNNVEWATVGLTAQNSISFYFFPVTTPGGVTSTIEFFAVVWGS